MPGSGEKAVSQARTMLFAIYPYASNNRGSRTFFLDPYGSFVERRFQADSFARYSRNYSSKRLTTAPASIRPNSGGM
jgi:hypothetical protein